jgi:hypothetical protein
MLAPFSRQPFDKQESIIHFEQPQARTHAQLSQGRGERITWQTGRIHGQTMDQCDATSILAEGAMTLPVTPSGGVLFAS